MADDATPAVEEKPSVDNGLGLRDFVQAHAQERDPADPEKSDDAPADTTKDETAVTDPPADKTAVSDPPAEAAKPAEVSATETKPADTPAPTPTTDPKWDTADNPYKKLADELGGKHAEVQQVANQSHQQLQAQARQIRILQAKVDGTYDESMETEGLPTTEEIAADSERKGRFDASRATNERMHGKDVVERLLFSPDSPWSKRYEPKPGQMPDPSLRWVHERVMSSADPVGEALRIVDLDLFHEKYGDTPAAIRKGIEAELRGNIEKEVRAKVTQEVEERFAKNRRQIPGNANGRGASKDAPASKDAAPKPLSSIGNPAFA